MDDLEMARVFRDTADYLRVHGKLETGFGWPGEPRCLVGAIGSACPEFEPCQPRLVGDQEREAWYQGLAPLVRSLGFDIIGEVYLFSDQSDTAAVIDRLESAALNLEIKALAASPEKNAAPREEVVATP